METLFLIIFWCFVFWCCWRLFLKRWINNRSATKRAKATFMANQIPEETYYEQAAYEISNDQIRPGLWAKAWSQAGGDSKRAEALYIKLRVEAMRKEAAAKIHEYTERENSYRGQPIEDSPACDSPRASLKTIVSCPHCAQKLRVDSGKYIEITCASCKHSFQMHT